MKKYANQIEQDSDRMYNYQNEEKYLRAKKKVDKIIGFYWHLAWYLIINTFLIGFIYAAQDDDSSFFNFGTFSTAIFWGIGLFFHWMGVFGPNIIMSEDWEKKKIKEIMEKDNTLWE